MSSRESSSSRYAVNAGATSPAGLCDGLGGLVGVGTGEQGESEIAAASDLLVALLGQHGSDESDQRGAVREEIREPQPVQLQPALVPQMPACGCRSAPSAGVPLTGVATDLTDRLASDDCRGDRRGRDWSPWAARNRFPIGQLRDDTKMAAVRRHENVRKARSVLGHSSQFRRLPCRRRLSMAQTLALASDVLAMPRIEWHRTPQMGLIRQISHLGLCHSWFVWCRRRKMPFTQQSPRTPR